MRLLLLTDQHRVVRYATNAFAPAGIAIDQAETCDEALDLVQIYDHHLIVLDQTDVAPLEALRRLRAAGHGTPVVWLSGDASAAERIRALELGADDCVGPQVGPEELVARSRAVVRRAAGHAASAIVVGDLTIDLGARTVTLAGQRLRITGKEFGILELLALKKGAVVSREAIMDHLYGGPEEPVAKIVDIHVCRIRRKLAAVTPEAAMPQTVILETVWGRGFLLRAPDAAADQFQLAA